MDVAASNHVSRSVNNSLPSSSVVGSQTSSQRPENRSFTSSNPRPSGGVPKLAMICGQKFNSPSGGVVRKLAMISGRKSNHPSYVARKLATIFRHMSGKLVTASYTRLPVKASVNSFLCLECEKKLRVCLQGERITLGSGLPQLSLISCLFFFLVFTRQLGLPG